MANLSVSVIFSDGAGFQPGISPAAPATRFWRQDSDAVSPVAAVAGDENAGAGPGTGRIADCTAPSSSSIMIMANARNSR
jgi:hypothetical protein